MKWFDKDFYEHLWLVKNTYGERWFEKVPDDDPNFKYCRNIAKQKKKEFEIEKKKDFIDAVWEVLDNTRINKIYDLAKALGLNYKKFTFRLRKYIVENEFRHVFILRNGYVLVENDVIKLISGNRNNLHKFVDLTIREIGKAVDSNEEFSGYKLYRYETWFKLKGYKKDIELTKTQKEELIGERLTRISS